ncbi:Protein CBG25701 [Caenorhabditis briggsae]|uniref:Protein CBG25701 n=1 Tax=Caenorhabditis briggsae TaxID=6238 RepID=B6IGW4_CAEBR|nr:Protein CBG25701 [Caenorhabditis briggsae]CAR99144.1 Protein CBG25701 [Caenorhabditis briggsae]
MSIIRPTLVSPAVFFSNLPSGYMTPQSPIGSVVTSVEITPVHSSEGSTAPSSPLNLESLHLDDEPESPLSSTEGLNGGSGSEADDEGEPQVVDEHMDWEDNV